MANSAEWKVVPLLASINQRYADTSVDGLLTNGYLQKDDVGTVWARRRAGFIEVENFSLPDGLYSEVGILRSLSGVVYTAGNRNVYKNNSLNYTFSVGASLSQIVFDQSTVTTLVEVYVSNGQEAAFDSGGGFSKIVDPNYPARTVNGSAYLNGFLYVMDAAGSIWGTPNQNDFSVWSATNVVNAWGTAGSAIAIRSYLNEVLAFKSFSVEVFYDSGNSVGSPLLPDQQINIRWGIFDPATIQKIDDQIFWVGRSETGDVAVIGMSSFNPTVISNESINRLLHNSSGVTFGSSIFSMGGDKFYAIALSRTLVAGDVAESIMIAYNLSTNSWSILRTSEIFTTDVGSIGIGIAMVCSTNNPNRSFLMSSQGQVFIPDDSSQFDSNHVSGNPAQIERSISMRLRTDNFTMGTSLRKMVSGLRVKADQKSASALRLRWSDDDYQTWSAWRTIDLSKSVPALPGLQGTFAKRAYEVEYSGSDPIRFSSLELLIALGDI